MKALEALVTLEVMDITISKMEKEVAIGREEAANGREAADEEEAAQKATTKGGSVVTIACIKVVKELEEEEAN